MPPRGRRHPIDPSSPVHHLWTVDKLKSLAKERFKSEFKSSVRTRDTIIHFLTDRDVDLSLPPSTATATNLEIPGAQGFTAAKPAFTTTGAILPITVTPGSLAPLPIVAPITTSGALFPSHDSLEIMKRPELKELAKRLPGYKSSITNKPDLLRFILQTSGTSSPSTPTVTVSKSPPTTSGSRTFTSFEDLRVLVEEKKTLGVKDVRAIAISYGWKPETGKRGKMAEYLLFLKNALGSGLNTGAAKTPITMMTPTPPLVGAPIVGVTVDTVEGTEEWPLHDMDKIKGLSISSLKNILKKFRITEALPETKEELLKLFKKKRCGKGSLTACEENEVCDMRNELCRSDLSGMSTKLNQYIFQGRRFWGSPEILEEIRKAVVDYEKSKMGTGARVEKEGGGMSETKEPEREDIQDSEENEIEPVRISRMMEDKEEYLRVLRKAIEATFSLAEEGTHIRSVGLEGSTTASKPFRPRFQLIRDPHAEEL
jgi:hypothetical protein